MLSYRIVALSADWQVLRFRRARTEIGPWMLAAGLLLLHLEWWPQSSRLPADAGIFLDMLLGMGMLLVVFDESRLHTRRLATLNALTTSIARAGENGAVAATALKELKDLMGADAAWFRLTDGRRLTVFQHIGLSAEFLRDRASVLVHDVDRDPRRLVRARGAGEQRAEEGGDGDRRHEAHDHGATVAEEDPQRAV